jgi:hypothetical protein
MCPAINSTRIDSAHGIESACVSSDIGATPPGEWHSAHRACTIGSTSSLNVKGDVVGLCASVRTDHIATVAVTIATTTTT